MLLCAEHLRIAFALDGAKSVPVRDVSFSVPENGRVALVGESGSGKTLTALALGNLVERAEISGEIRGKARISYIFQNPMQSLDPVMRIGKQIRENAADRDAEALLENVGLPRECARKYPCELSGGQQQRAMIAMALAMKPDLLVADEPTTALDVTTQKEVLDLVSRVADERGMAVLLITHNLGLVARYSSFVNVMYAGEIVERGQTREVLGNPRHPYTAGLIAAVPSIAAPRDAPLADIPGVVPPPTAWPKGCAFAPRCRYAEDKCKKEETHEEIASLFADCGVRCIRVRR
ncbi:MAG: ABC transporter ATP-binding protein [Kiritimatiellae bacterium]|nr:ABC transporter ATP-binding protein [Kiritimatiellia bacterium]